jgi:hypothetical protein
MNEDLLARLKDIDLTILSEVVQQDQGSSSFEISEWCVKRLSDQGAINPDGLWLFSGEGSDQAGFRPWSVVVKIFQRPEGELRLSDVWHWKREVLLAKSGLTERMPGPVKAPRFYRVDEFPDGAWLWMEHVESNRANPWVLDDYVFAAHQLGTWNGRLIKEMPALSEPWLARKHYRTQFPDLDRDQIWGFPLHQKHMPEDTRARCERLWTEREMFYSAIESLPHCFTHMDSQRRNLFIRRGMDEQNELVLVDWAQCGLAPLGVELCALVGWSTAFREWPTAALPELDEAAFGSYLQGLRQAGWSGEADQIRLGNFAWFAILMVVYGPGNMAIMCSAEARPRSLKIFGLAEEELYLYWLPLLNFALDDADEARILMG